MINFWPFKRVKIRPCIPEGQVVYAVGDIHGRLDCLGTVLDLIDQDRVQHSGDEIKEIFLGDYVDRGMQSRQVIDRLIARQAETGAILLRGNHEEFMRKALTDKAAASPWSQCGGLETMRSYGVDVRLPLTEESFKAIHQDWVSAIPAEHIAFLRALPYSYQLGDYFFCHAGIRPGISLDRQDPEDLMSIRDEFLGSTRWHGACVVHGHTPVEEPELLPNRINLDTGAYITGRLSCLKLVGTRQTVLART